MDRGKGIFSSFLGSIRPKKTMNPVFAVSGDHSNTLNDPVFAVSEDKRKTLDELIASWEAQPDVHFHNFSSEELTKATGNFNSDHLVNEDAFYAFYKGFFKNQPILIKKFKHDSFMWPSGDVNFVNTRDTVVASQLSSHGYSLTFIGRCQELSAQVFEYQGNVTLLSDVLNQRRETEALTWRNRLSIAHDIANALVILHTSLSTPLILRDLRPSNILIDEFGVPKLLDFSMCIQIPEGESQVEDAVMGTYGYAEPQYVATGVLTEKSDVFSFGVVLLELLTGQRAVDVTRGANLGFRFPCDGPGRGGTCQVSAWDHVFLGDKSFLHERVKESVKKGKLRNFVDSRMIERGLVEREQEYRAFGALALRCTQENRKERPKMTHVAAELARIESANQANSFGKR